MHEMTKKWDFRYHDVDIATAKPAKVLLNNLHLLPEHGTALDLACGMGGNAIMLAKKGLQVDAIDISTVIIEKLDDFAKQQQLSLSAIKGDVEKQPLPKSHYDIIIVSYFLDRNSFSKIIGALKSKGMLFYQTWSKERVTERGPSTAQFRLEKGELLSLCQELNVVYYREEGRVGDMSKGIRDEVLYIGQKP